MGNPNLFYSFIKENLTRITDLFIDKSCISAKSLKALNTKSKKEKIVFIFMLKNLFKVSYLNREKFINLFINAQNSEFELNCRLFLKKKYFINTVDPLISTHHIFFFIFFIFSNSSFTIIKTPNSILVVILASQGNIAL